MIHWPSSVLESRPVGAMREGSVVVCSEGWAGRSAEREHPSTTRKTPPASDAHLPSCELTLILPLRGVGIMASTREGCCDPRYTHPVAILFPPMRTIIEPFKIKS